MFDFFFCEYVCFFFHLVPDLEAHNAYSCVRMLTLVPKLGLNPVIIILLNNFLCLFIFCSVIIERDHFKRREMVRMLGMRFCAIFYFMVFFLGSVKNKQKKRSKTLNKEDVNGCVVNKHNFERVNERVKERERVRGKARVCIWHNISHTNIRL